MYSLKGFLLYSQNNPRYPDIQYKLHTCDSALFQFSDITNFPNDISLAYKLIIQAFNTYTKKKKYEDFFFQNISWRKSCITYSEFGTGSLLTWLALRST